MKRRVRGYLTGMGEITLDWSSATVRKRRLEVALRGEVPSGWKDSFERTVGLLGGGSWGKVKLKKGRVRVSHVEAGSEDRVRHFLESVVLQAGSAREHPEPEVRDGHEQDAEADEVDHRMCERFRSFAAL